MTIFLHWFATSCDTIHSTLLYSTLLFSLWNWSHIDHIFCSRQSFYYLSCYPKLNSSLRFTSVTVGNTCFPSLSPSSSFLYLFFFLRSCNIAMIAKCTGRRNRIRTSFLFVWAWAHSHFNDSVPVTRLLDQSMSSGHNPDQSHGDSMLAGQSTLRGAWCMEHGAWTMDAQQRNTVKWFKMINLLDCWSLHLE